MVCFKRMSALILIPIMALAYVAVSAPAQASSDNTPLRPAAIGQQEVVKVTQFYGGVVAADSNRDPNDPENSPSDSTTAQWDSTFDSVLTNGLWNSANISLKALAVYCVAFVPGVAQKLCVAIGSAVFGASIQGAILRLGPPNGRCLNAETSLGIPPFELSYVRCP